MRAGAQRLIRQAVEAELKAFLVEHRDEREAGARLAVVRNGHLPGRTILAGVGEVRVRVPKTRDRTGQGRRFRSELLRPYTRFDSNSVKCF